MVPIVLNTLLSIFDLREVTNRNGWYEYFIFLFCLIVFGYIIFKIPIYLYTKVENFITLNSLKRELHMLVKFSYFIEEIIVNYDNHHIKDKDKKVTGDKKIFDKIVLYVKSKNYYFWRKKI